MKSWQEVESFAVQACAGAAEKAVGDVSADAHPLLHSRARLRVNSRAQQQLLVLVLVMLLLLLMLLPPRPPPCHHPHIITNPVHTDTPRVTVTLKEPS